MSDRSRAGIAIHQRRSKRSSSLITLPNPMSAAHVTDWAKDPFARGAYSYATLATRTAQDVLTRWDGGPVLISGEALYRGRDMGTVEAALASGRQTARTILKIDT
ncbi:FAD-dependent oxidoreductase [Bradyrhizobium sp.]|uniref:FAD-dependent oxidoreductase n=1 Tax=Bradyrhizobium sp. TaxID=376 RepID=UPI00391DB254